MSWGAKYRLEGLHHGSAHRALRGFGISNSGHMKANYKAFSHQ